jgi:hypothetical protein
VKLASKKPLFGKTVRESRRAEAEFYKGHHDSGCRPLSTLSERRIKKLWAKVDRGQKPAGREERKLVRYFSIEECRHADHEMLCNAY